MGHVLTSHSLFDAHTSQDRGTDYAYVRAMGAVLTQMMHSPRVHDYYDRWTHITDPTQTITAASATLDQFMEQVRAAMAKTLSRESELAAQDLLPTAPFPWVARGLREGFIFDLAARKGFILPGEEFTISLVIPDNPVPSLMNPSPSTAEALRELSALHRATRRPKGRRLDVETIDRNGVWYVRHHVDGVSKNQLSREFHAPCAKNPKRGGTVHTWEHHRTSVTNGLTQFQRILDLTTFQYLRCSPERNL